MVFEIYQISNLGLSFGSVPLNGTFEILKITEIPIPWGLKQYVFSDNHGQNIVGKLAKLNKIGVSLECFTDDFL